MTLARSREKARRLRARVERAPLAHLQWLPPQFAFLSSRKKRVALRGPNQALGKTFAGAAELIWRMLGVHPFKPVRPGPIIAWVVCGSREQSRTVQAKVWALVPKDQVAEGCYFDPGKGEFHGKYPELRFKNGSVAVFKSGKGATVSLASGTVDYVWIDEPPDSSRVYTELVKRVMRRRGDVFMTFTPVNAPVAWIKEECERGAIVDLHFPLRAEYLIPVGSEKPMVLQDGTVCDQAWIDELTRETLPHERPVVLGGEWEFRLEGAIFQHSWKPDVHKSKARPSGRSIWLGLGIDHGDRTNKQTVILVAVDTSGRWPRVYVLDEWCAPGTTTTDQDAEAILAMLARHGIAWRELDFVCGDRAHRSGGDKVIKKSNDELGEALAELLRLPGGVAALSPPIKTAKRGEGQNQGSESRGLKFLHQAMLREGHFFVHPRCARLVVALGRYTGEDNDDKDPLDALRYALWSWIFPKKSTAGTELRLYG